jgi:putative Mg2+ transporter-C (MgtC) family protein
VNVLLAMAGRPTGSFVMNDLMRLPLGILTGVGFIGGGAILRRDNLVVGVTTAATIWLGTVIGLCLGGGQLTLGFMATLLGLFALWVLKWVEDSLKQMRYVRLTIALDVGGPSDTDVRRRLTEDGLSVVKCDVSVDAVGQRRELDFELCAFRRSADIEPPILVAQLAGEAGVVKFQWRVMS